MQAVEMKLKGFATGKVEITQAHDGFTYLPSSHYLCVVAHKIIPLPLLLLIEGVICMHLLCYSLIMAIQAFPC